MSSDDDNELKLTDSGSGDVPVFGCIVYVSTNPQGEVRSRVANLAGLECTAASERQALGAIVAAFKERLAELLRSNTPIDWIEPPVEPEANEQKRFIPVHL
jgi:hypothetical protein